MEFKEILFPFDYSDRCRGAVPFVRNWVETTRAHLTVVYVVEDLTSKYPASIALPLAYPEKLLTAS